MIYRNALSHNAGLLHSPRPAKLLHVPAEVTFSALVPEAGFTLAAAGPPAPGSRRATAGRHLNSRCGRPNLGLRPVGHPLLKTRSKWWTSTCKNLLPWLWLACCSPCTSSHMVPTSYLVENKLGSSWTVSISASAIAPIFQPLSCCHGRSASMKIRHVTMATCPLCCCLMRWLQKMKELMWYCYSTTECTAKHFSPTLKKTDQKNKIGSHKHHRACSHFQNHPLLQHQKE